MRLRIKNLLRGTARVGPECWVEKLHSAPGRLRVASGRRGRLRAAAELTRVWDTLPPATALRVIQAAPEAFIELLRDGTQGFPPRAIARLVADLGDASLSALLIPCLLGDDPAAAKGAEDALLRIAGSCLGDPDISAWLSGRESDPAARLAPGHGRAALHASLATLAATYPEHRRRGVLRTAIALLDPPALAFPALTMDPLAVWFRDPEPASHMAIRGELKKEAGPIVRLRAWEWLGRDAAGAAALDRITQGASLDEHIAVLDRWHLVHSPRRARKLGTVRISAKRTAGVVPDANRLAQLTPRQRRGCIGLLGGMSAEGAEIERRLAPFLNDADSGVRFAAMRTLAPPDCGSYCSDPDPGIAGLAAMRRALCGSGPETTWEALSASPHALVRRIAAEESPVNDPWQPASVRSRIAARRRLLADRRGFIAELRGVLIDGDIERQIAAVTVACSLHLCHEFELELLGAAATQAGGAGEAAGNGFAFSPGSRLLSMLAVALGDSGSGACVTALRSLTRHPEPRIRSNALEALLRAARRRGEPLPTAAIELKGDPHHRVSASALRGVLLSACGPEATQAAAELASMLADGRPLRRLAGLWAMDRLTLAGKGAALEPLAGVLADMARTEPEPEVRERAVRIAARMLVVLRSGWGERARDVAPTCQAGAGRA